MFEKKRKIILVLNGYSRIFPRLFQFKEIFKFNLIRKKKRQCQDLQHGRVLQISGFLGKWFNFKNSLIAGHRV